jgi:hypothetical protein
MRHMIFNSDANIYDTDRETPLDPVQASANFVKDFLGISCDVQKFYDYIENFSVNKILKEYTWNGYWISSWKIETEKLDASVSLSNEGRITVAEEFVTSRVNRIAIRGISYQLGYLENGKRKTKMFYWCARKKELVSIARVSYSVKEDEQKSNITASDIVDMAIRAGVSICEYPRMRKMSDAAAQKIDLMGIETDTESLRRELFSRAGKFNQIKSNSEFVDVLVREYKKARIQSL